MVRENCCWILYCNSHTKAAGSARSTRNFFLSLATTWYENTSFIVDYPKSVLKPRSEISQGKWVSCQPDSPVSVIMTSWIDLSAPPHPAHSLHYWFSTCQQSSTSSYLAPGPSSRIQRGWTTETGDASRGRLSVDNLKRSLICLVRRMLFLQFALFCVFFSEQASLVRLGYHGTLFFLCLANNSAVNKPHSTEGAEICSGCGISGCCKLCCSVGTPLCGGRCAACLRCSLLFCCLWLSFRQRPSCLGKI